MPVVVVGVVNFSAGKHLDFHDIIFSQYGLVFLKYDKVFEILRELCSIKIVALTNKKT